MKNFLSYEDSTVFPGTRLNLVVGPNGAGKSTIVGAMVLGLGFPLKVCPAPRPTPRKRACSWSVRSAAKCGGAART